MAVAAAALRHRAMSRSGAIEELAQAGTVTVTLTLTVTVIVTRADQEVPGFCNYS